MDVEHESSQGIEDVAVVATTGGPLDRTAGSPTSPSKSLSDVTQTGEGSRCRGIQEFSLAETDNENSAQVHTAATQEPMKAKEQYGLRTANSISGQAEQAQGHGANTAAWMIPMTGPIDLSRLPFSARCYLRILGRNEELEERKQSISAEALANEELRSGYAVLAEAYHSEPKTGFFFEPEDVTAEALREYPQLPWLYQFAIGETSFPTGPITLGGQLQRRLTDEWLLKNEAGWPDFHQQLRYSPYVKPSRGIYISNVIIPLPTNCSAAQQDDEVWQNFVHVCYTIAHPIGVSARVNSLSEKMLGDPVKEGVILAAMDREVSPFFKLYPGDKAHRDKRAERALLLKDLAPDEDGAAH